MHDEVKQAFLAGLQPSSTPEALVLLILPILGPKANEWDVLLASWHLGELPCTLTKRCSKSTHPVSCAPLSPAVFIGGRHSFWMQSLRNATFSGFLWQVHQTKAPHPKKPWPRLGTPGHRQMEAKYPRSILRALRAPRISIIWWFTIRAYTYMDLAVPGRHLIASKTL